MIIQTRSTGHLSMPRLGSLCCRCPATRATRATLRPLPGLVVLKQHGSLRGEKGRQVERRAARLLQRQNQAMRFGDLPMWARRLAKRQDMARWERAALWKLFHRGSILHTVHTYFIDFYSGSTTIYPLKMVSFDSHVSLPEARSGELSPTHDTGRKIRKVSLGTST